MPKSGGTFTGNISLGTYSLNFVNTSGTTHTLDRVILESMYTNYASWKTTFPTVDLTPYDIKAHATFSTDITLGTNGFTNASGVPHSLYTNYICWKATFPNVDLTPYSTKTYVDTSLLYFATRVELLNYMPCTLIV